MNAKIIDLSRYTSPGVGILADRDRGEHARKKEGLDEFDRSEGQARVIIPDAVYSVNSSFFLGLFDKSINHLGPDRFREKYLFEGPDADRTREEGIRMAIILQKPFRPQRPQVA